jgi:hypothetical protein
MSSSVDKYKSGVNAVTISPMELAAQSQDAMLAGVTDAITSGRWAAALRKRSLPDWKQQTATTGADRLATGARAAQPKMQQHLTAWLPVAQQIHDTAQGMPKGSIEDAVARVRMAITMAKQFKQAKGG